jgi:sulfatase maturation enzyme AslB (radical SAM superfamily)
MGGETLLTDRFEDFVDFMIDHKRFDLCFSFVTNGTIFRPELIQKLKQFRRVGIEVSVETVDEHNAYQRQRTDTELVLSNIKKYIELCNKTSVTVTLRPAPSLLSIGYYTELLQYALDHKLVVKSNLCYNPRFLSAEILPENVKQIYQRTYEKFLDQLKTVEIASDYNASHPNNYQSAVKEQANMCLSVLQTPTPADSEQQLEAMVRYCEKWDRVYGYNAKKLYPEFQEILDRYDYSISG